MSYFPKQRPNRFLLWYCTCCILVCLLTLFPVVAAAGSEPEFESAEEEYRSQMVLFGGNTHDGADYGASFSFGYLYRLGKYFRVGGFAEHAGGDFDLWLVGFDAVMFPIAGWYVRAAPCAEFEDSETRFVFRVGTGYEFEFGPRWSVAPEVNYDTNRRERDHTFVYGIAVAYKF